MHVISEDHGDDDDDDNRVRSEDYDDDDIGKDDQHEVMSFTIKMSVKDTAMMAYCQEMMISTDIHDVDDTVRYLNDGDGAMMTMIF